MIEVFAVEAIKESYSLSNTALGYLPANQREELRRFRNQDDAQRSMVGNLLIRIIINQKIGLNNCDIVFDEDSFGKPSLCHYPDFHFSISHSGKWVVCAVHECRVGVDIEKIQPIDLDIAHKIFSKSEYDDFQKIDSKQRLAYFYQLWTLKESYVKAVGKGLSIPLDSFSFKITGDIITLNSQKGLNNYFFKQYDLGPDYQMSVCGSTSDFSECIDIKELDEIYSRVALI